MCVSNSEYIAQQVKTNDFIYIDTCTLLDVEKFNIFINNSKSIFLENSKKLTIPKCVLSEIEKFQICPDETKRENANEVLNIIYGNLDFICIEEDINFGNNIKSFTDMKILGIIFQRRRNYTQLLISNDRGLTKDAFNYNHLESVNGNRVNVCYLNHHGNMCICDCVKEIKDKFNSSPQEPKVIIKKEIIEKEPSLFEKYGVPTITYLLGLMTKQVLDIAKH